MVAARFTIGVLVGVIAPGVTAAHASPLRGSAVAPASHGKGNPHNQAQPSASTVTASSASSSQPSAQSSSGRAKTSGGVHAASLRPDSGSGAVSVPGNCQSPQCQAVEATLDSVTGSPVVPSAQVPAPPATTASPTTVPPTTAASTPSPRVLASSHRAPTSRAAVRPAGTPGAVSSPPPTGVPSVLDEPIQLATGGWQGVSLQAATNLRIPILFGAAVLLFVLLQALVDRRDPKMSRAPERGQDDSVGFS